MYELQQWPLTVPKRGHDRPYYYLISFTVSVFFMFCIGFTSLLWFTRFFIQPDVFSSSWMKVLTVCLVLSAPLLLVSILVFLIDWGERVFVCVCFSCSWRFTFYLLAFIAGLAALIDVSTAVSASNAALITFLVVVSLIFLYILELFVLFALINLPLTLQRRSMLTHPSADSADINTPVQFCSLTGLICPFRNPGCMTWRRCGKAFLCWYVCDLIKEHKQLTFSYFHLL